MKPWPICGTFTTFAIGSSKPANITPGRDRWKLFSARFAEKGIRNPASTDVSNVCRIFPAETGLDSLVFFRCAVSEIAFMGRRPEKISAALRALLFVQGLNSVVL